MARFDVFALRSTGALVLDVQAEILDPLNTRVVVPLMPLAEAPKPAHRLNPIFDVTGQRVVMVTQFLSAVRIAELGPNVGTLAEQQDTIKDALDMVFLGF